MPVQVASLFGVLRLNTSQWDSGNKEAQDDMLSMRQRLSDVGSSLQNFGGQLSLASAPLLAFGVQGLRTAGDFESSMLMISARTGIVGEELQSISDFVLQMGADTIYSGQQAADAMLQLLSSGQNAEQAMSTLPTVLNLAAASGNALGETADVVTDIMAAFNLQITDSTMVADALAAAAGASSADVASLGQGFANVGGIARQFGLDVGTTAATLAVLAENGTKGAEAGTALKSMLLNMQTDRAQAAFRDLGVSFYDTEGNARPLAEVIGDIKVAMQDKSPEEQNRLMQALAGTYGITALSALLGSMGIDEMKASMDQVPDAADIAATQMGGFNTTIGSLLGSLETLMIHRLGPLMEKYLTPLVQSVIDGVNAFDAWLQVNPALSNALMVFFGVLALGGPTLFAAGTALKVIALLFTPMGLTVLAVAGLGFALAAIFSNPVIQEGLASLPGAWEVMTTAIRLIIENWWRDLQIRFNDVLIGVLQFASDIEKAMGIEQGTATLQLEAAIQWKENMLNGDLIAAQLAEMLAEGGPINLAMPIEMSVNGEEIVTMTGNAIEIAMQNGSFSEANMAAVREFIQRGMRDAVQGMLGHQAGSAAELNQIQDWAVNQLGFDVEEIGNMVNELIAEGLQFDPASLVQQLNAALASGETIGVSMPISAVVDGELVRTNLGTALREAFESGMLADADVAAIQAFLEEGYLRAVQEGSVGRTTALEQLADELMNLDLQDAVLLNAETTGEMLGIGVASGIQQRQERAVTATEQLAMNINSTMASNLGTQSPSTIWRGYGSDTVLGLVLGLTAGVPLLAVPLALLNVTLTTGWALAARSMAVHARRIIDTANDVKGAFLDVAAAARSASSAVGSFGGGSGPPSHDYPGPAAGGQPYSIGTPEVFIPSTSGFIQPIGGATMNTTTINNPTFVAAPGESPEAFGQRVMDYVHSH